jgi:hypothetical protein
MSCTDKLAAWTAIGIQGALLTHLVRPIYLASIVVGGHGHPVPAVTATIANRLRPLHASKGVGALFAHSPPAVHRAQTGDEPSLGTGKHAKQPWSSLCIAWSVAVGAEQINPTTGLHTPAVYPYVFVAFMTLYF